MSPPIEPPSLTLTQVNRAVAHRIRVELLGQGKSIKALAAETSINPKTLLRRLHRTDPTPFQPGELLRVAAVLGVNVAALTDPAPEPNGGEAA